MVPSPLLAVILLFPTTGELEAMRQAGAAHVCLFSVAGTHSSWCCSQHLCGFAQRTTS